MMADLFGVTASVPTLTLAWAMPSRWTFTMPPVREFLGRHLTIGEVSVDPFAGQSAIATYRNDLARGGVDAEEFCHRLIGEGVVADAVLFDPPYSPRQISECYKSIGRAVTTADTQNAAPYKRVRAPLVQLLKPGGLALSFGWQSAGFSAQWETLEVLLVRHGGAHNDTICVAQRKPWSMARPSSAPPTAGLPHTEGNR